MRQDHYDAQGSPPGPAPDLRPTAIFDASELYAAQEIIQAAKKKAAGSAAGPGLPKPLIIVLVTLAFVVLAAASAVAGYTLAG